MNSQEFTFVAIADVQTSNQPDNPDFSIGGSPSEYRRFTTGTQRMQEFVDEFNGDGTIQACVNLGDWVDANSTDAANELDALMVQTTDLPTAMISTDGNHGRLLFTGANFWTAMDTSHVARDNEYTDASGYISYTYDVGGIRFVVLSSGGDRDEAGKLTWFETQLNASTLPVVVLTHYPLWLATEWNWTYASNFQDYQDLIDAAENVQAVICGHYHPDDIDTVINDVPYINLNGSVLAPDVADNAYFKIQLIPNAVWTPNGMKANIKITGYGSIGITRTKDYTHYLIAGE